MIMVLGLGDFVCVKKLKREGKCLRICEDGEMGWYVGYFCLVG